MISLRIKKEIFKIVGMEEAIGAQGSLFIMSPMNNSLSFLLYEYIT